jgi:hypothetical protein
MNDRLKPSATPKFDLTRDFAAAAGFYDGASARVAEMMGFCDASVPR